MPTFTYQAETERGDIVSGNIEAADEAAAVAGVKAQGFWPRQVRRQLQTLVPIEQTAVESSPHPVTPSPSLSKPEVRSPTPAPDLAPFLVSVPLPDMAVMYRQLATLLQAGVPMVQSVSTLAEQTRNQRLRGILQEMAREVGLGNPISMTMARYPSVFPQMHLEMIRAAEITGLLDQMCNRLSGYIEREVEIRRKMQRETLYPKIVLFVAGIVMLLLTFLQAGQAGAVGLLLWGVTVAGAGFGLWWLWRYADQYPAIGATLDNIKMRIPGTGGVARRYATARFTRALGILYGSGILLTNAVAIAARSCGNRAIQETMERNAPNLMNGEGVAAFLASSGMLSPSAVQMARTGEQTGSLDIMMDKVADYLESEADVKAHQLATFTGVAALVLAALVVLFIALSFYGGQMASAVNTAGG